MAPDIHALRASPTDVARCLLHFHVRVMNRNLKDENSLSVLGQSNRTGF